METKILRGTSFRAVLLLGAMALLSIAGCGGGGGGGDSSLLCAKAQTHITPPDGSTNVPWNTTVTLTMDKDTIDCSSVTSSTFTLATAAGAAVAGSLACDGTTVTFTPDALLAPNTQYVAYVTTMKNAAGDNLCDHSAWRFTTAPDFTVTTTVPAANATAIGVDAKVTATFSSAADCTTVNATTFTLAGTGAVAGTVSCSGSTATFSPDALLTPSTQYTATLAATVKGTNGVTLSSAESWTFTTSPANRVWIKDPLQPISAKWVEAAGADDAGNVMLLYAQQVQSSGVKILTATRYKRSPATPWLEGWYNPWSLWSHAGSSPAKIAVSKNGNALVLGKVDTGVLNYAYFDGTSWSGETAASVGGGVTEFQPVIDDNGNAMLVWSASSAGTDQVYARYYNATTGTLGDVQTVGDTGWAHLLTPRFAFDSAGNGTVVYGAWQFVWDGSYTSGITTRDYDKASGTWSPSVTQVVINGHVKNPDIAFDKDNNAVVVWLEEILWDPSETPRNYYWAVDAAHRAAGSADWTEAIMGAGWDPKGDASDPHVVTTPNGDAIATWTYTQHGHTDPELNAAYHPAGLGLDWGALGESVTPLPVDSYSVFRAVWAGPNGGVGTPSLVVDKNNKLTLVYSMSDGTRSNVYARTFNIADRKAGASGWTDPVELDATNENANGPLITVDGTAATMTIWNQWNPDYSTPLNDFWYLRQ